MVVRWTSGWARWTAAVRSSAVTWPWASRRAAMIARRGMVSRPPRSRSSWRMASWRLSSPAADMAEAYWYGGYLAAGRRYSDLGVSMQPTPDPPRPRSRLSPWLLVALVVVVLAAGVARPPARPDGRPGAGGGGGAR